MDAFEIDDRGEKALGEITAGQFAEVFEQALEREKTIQSDYFSVGVARSKEDFLEISPLGDEQFLILSDVIKPQNLWRRFFGPQHIEKIVTGRQAVLEIASFYMNNSRKAFEHKYCE